jgi:hypothetical protein
MAVTNEYREFSSASRPIYQGETTEEKRKKKKVAWGEGCAANVLTPSSPSSKNIS